MSKLNGSILPMSQILPEPVRAALARASKIESRLEFGECPERAAAVDSAIANAKRNYPQFFQ